MQNRPPVFQGSLAAVINEDSPIGTLVMSIQAKDGDHGQPRKIVYDLLTSEQLIDYHFLLMISKKPYTQIKILFFCPVILIRSNGLLFAGCKIW